jgi:ribonuclease P protein component
MALPRHHRIKKSSDFQDILREGKVIRGSFLFFKYRSVGNGESKIGVAISRRAWKTIVEKNAIKRLVVATLEKNKELFVGGWEGIIVVNKVPEDLAELSRDVQHMVQLFLEKTAQ